MKFDIIFIVPGILTTTFILIAWLLKRTTHKNLIAVISSLSKVYGAILIPLLLILITLNVQTISNNLEFQKHDLAIMQEFQKIYFEPENPSNLEMSKKKLALRYIDLINDPETRYQLRAFVVWDTLHSTIRKPGNKGPKYKFNPNDTIWGNIAVIMANMNRDYPERYREFMKMTIGTDAPREFDQYASKEEIRKIFDNIFLIRSEAKWAGYPK